MELIPEFFSDIKGFEWDEGNSEKNWHRHQVTCSETEQVFLNHPLLLSQSLKSTEEELRYFALGQTNASRPLAVVFTLRGSLVQIISARPMSRRERRAYAEA